MGVLNLGSIFEDSPEYRARKARPFVPPTATLKQIYDAVPKHLLRRDPLQAAYYVARDLLLAGMFLRLATYMDPVARVRVYPIVGPVGAGAVRWAMWGVYWWFQSLVGAGIFCLGHDAGHGTLFNSSRVNNTVGLTLHTILLIPYFAWRSTHHAHHKATSSIERDENYVPYTRKDYGLVDEHKAQKADYAEVFEETPIYTLFRVFIMQFFGWWLYLTCNTMGSKMYPPGTASHWKPDSLLFKPEQRGSLVLSNVAVCVMLGVLAYIGPSAVARYYLVPYLLTNHWIVMFTYLHHSDPTIPHYRKEEWSFLRGAAATCDRPLLGWMGRFFFHNISHDHVAHHFFVGAPFYNGPEITKAIRNVLKEDYNYDSTNSFYALWRSFTQCLFIEEEGGIVFYKNGDGEAARTIQEDAVVRIKEAGWDPEEQDRTGN